MSGAMRPPGDLANVDEFNDGEFWRTVYQTPKSPQEIPVQHDGKDDEGKLDLTLLPPGPLVDVAIVFQKGAEKYTREGYLDVPNAGHRYYAALRRHLMEFELGEDRDVETHVHHFAHAAACLLILLALRDAGQDIGAWRSRANRGKA